MSQEIVRLQRPTLNDIIPNDVELSIGARRTAQRIANQFGTSTLETMKPALLSPRYTVRAKELCLKLASRVLQKSRERMRTGGVEQLGNEFTIANMVDGEYIDGKAQSEVNRFFEECPLKDVDGYEKVTLEFNAFANGERRRAANEFVASARSALIARGSENGPSVDPAQQLQRLWQSCLSEKIRTDETFAQVLHSISLELDFSPAAHLAQSHFDSIIAPPLEPSRLASAIAFHRDLTKTSSLVSLVLKPGAIDQNVVENAFTRNPIDEEQFSWVVARFQSSFAFGTSWATRTAPLLKFAVENARNRAANSILTKLAENEWAWPSNPEQGGEGTFLIHRDPPWDASTLMLVARKLERRGRADLAEEVRALSPRLTSARVEGDSGRAQLMAFETDQEQPERPKRSAKVAISDADEVFVLDDDNVIEGQSASSNHQRSGDV